MAEEVGHWTINGITACESPKTVGIRYWSGKYQKEVYTHCGTTHKEFVLMRAAVLKEYPDAEIEWVPGPCRKTGAEL